ncbi:MAG TPA: hypothetical protein DDX92_05620 [Flavobacteriales bacterium]|nr:hypothetical protein [Flavobacteriales bacterium]
MQSVHSWLRDYQRDDKTNQDNGENEPNRVIRCRNHKFVQRSFKMKDSGKLLVILTAGFAAGAVVGILFAPDIGENTRSRIKEKASEIGDELEKQYLTEIDKLKQRVSELKDELANSMKDTKSDEQES